MNESFFVRSLQTFRDLNPRLQDSRFRHACLFGHEIIQASVIDQFHHEIDLPVRVSGGVNLDNVRMIDRGGEARFLFQARRFRGLGAQFFAQELEATRRSGCRAPCRPNPSADAERSTRVK